MICRGQFNRDVDLLSNISLHQIVFFLVFIPHLRGVQSTLYYTAQEKGTGNGTLVMMHVWRGVPTLSRKVALIHFLLLAGGLLLYNNERPQDLFVISTSPKQPWQHVVSTSRANRFTSLTLQQQFQRVTETCLIWGLFLTTTRTSPALEMLLQQKYRSIIS